MPPAIRRFGRPRTSALNVGRMASSAQLRERLGRAGFCLRPSGVRFPFSPGFGGVVALPESGYAQGVQQGAVGTQTKEM